MGSLLSHPWTTVVKSANDVKVCFSSSSAKNWIVMLPVSWGGGILHASTIFGVSSRWGMPIAYVGLKAEMRSNCASVSLNLDRQILHHHVCRSRWDPEWGVEPRHHHHHQHRIHPLQHPKIRLVGSENHHAQRSNSVSAIAEMCSKTAVKTCDEIDMRLTRLNRWLSCDLLAAPSDHQNPPKRTGDKLKAIGRCWVRFTGLRVQSFREKVSGSKRETVIKDDNEKNCETTLSNKYLTMNTMVQ